MRICLQIKPELGKRALRRQRQGIFQVKAKSVDRVAYEIVGALKKRYLVSEQENKQRHKQGMVYTVVHVQALMLA